MNPPTTGRERSRPGRDELRAVALALAVWTGAALARPLPGVGPAGAALLVLVVAAGVLAVGGATAGAARSSSARRVGNACRAWAPVALGVSGMVGAGILASVLAARAWEAVAPARGRSFAGTVVLVSDPADTMGAVRADVADGEGRYELWARGPAAATVRRRLAGERVEVRGRLVPRPDGLDGLARRHVVARLEADEASPAPGVDPVSRLANGFRRLLERGASVLPDEPRALFAGFVLGDGRGQGEDLADAFRASGLSHLMVVSGENVAFVLVVVRPLASRLGRRSRFVVVLGALAFFVLLTRFEPSVLRAAAMAAVAALGTLLGREVASLRSLALGVAGLLLVDPLLAGSLGFRLSAAASLGIILLARPITDRLPGPRAVAEVAGVTVAAQVAVAPLLVPTFGGLPLVALPANVAAAPAAGPVMVWGLTAGVVAGLAGPAVAGVLHTPTRLLLGWVAGVARVAAALPVGELRAGHLVALVGVGVVVAVARRRPIRRAAGVVAGLVVVVAATSLPVLPAGPVDIGGARLWADPGRGAVLLEVDGRVRQRPLLEGLRAYGVRRVDLLVGRTGSAATGATVAMLGRVVPVGTVLGPPGNRFGARVPDDGESWVVAGRQLVVRNDGTRLALEVAADGVEGDGPSGPDGPGP